MLKLSGTVILSVLTLSIAEPPVNNYLPPNSSPGSWSGYPSNFEAPTSVGKNPSYDKPGIPTGSHGNQAPTSDYSDSQAPLNLQQYSSFSQRPPQYRLNSHGPRANNGYRNLPVSPSYGPPNNNKGNTYNQPPSLSYLPSHEPKPNSDNFSQYGPPAVPNYGGQSGNHFNPPMNSYIPPSNAGSRPTSHGNRPNCQQKDQIPNSYGPPSSNSMGNRPVSSSYGPPQNSNRPPSNVYLPANSQPQTPEYQSGYPSSGTGNGQNNGSPSNSYAPPVEDNNSSPPSSFDQAVPSPKPEATEAPPLIKSRNNQNPSNSYSSYTDNQQFSFEKSLPIVVPNTLPMFGQKTENFGTYNTGYQPENRQNRLRQGLTQAPYSDRAPMQVNNKGYRSQVPYQGDRLSERNSYSAQESTQGPNKGYSYNGSNLDNLVQSSANQHSTSGFEKMNAAQNGYSYDPPSSPSGHGQVQDESGYRY